VWLKQDVVSNPDRIEAVVFGAPCAFQDQVFIGVVAEMGE
jgi:hypothetical protein